MKKILAAACAAVLLFSTMCGCNQNDVGQESSDLSSTPESQSSELSDEPITLNFNAE